MIKPTRIAEEVTNSPIRKMFNIANKLENVISFTVGEPDFVTPQNIIRAACDAMQAGQTHYTLNAGILPLRQSISRRIQNDYQLSYDPDKEIIVTAGAMEALMLCMMVTIDPGDEVIVTDPYWPNYINQIVICGGIPRFVTVYERDGFVYQLDNLKKAITNKTKALLINSPANPTGGVIGHDVLVDIAKLAMEHDFLVMSDDVYRYFLYDGAEFASIAALDGMRERTVIIDSLSKSYAMTGWRLGYAVGPNDIVKNMIKVQENVVACVNTPTQFAAIEALEGTREPLNEMLAKYASRRELLIDGINRIEHLSCIRPKGAFYVFANISQTGLASDEFAMRLLKEKGVVVVPGSGFGRGGEGFIRLSYATSEENIREGLKRIDEFARSL